MPLRGAVGVVLTALLALVLALAPANAETPSRGEILRPVRVQLKWTHQFQFAGLYAAIEKGYFEDAGLSVELLEGRPDLDAVDVVLSGGAEFGIGSSELVIDRSKGKPVVAVAPFFQHSPFILVARKGDDLQSVHDLIGKRIMVEPHAAELLAYLRLEQVPLDRLKLIPHTGGLTGITQGTADAMTSYATTQPFQLREMGAGFQVFSPRASGIDFYGDTLFTTEAMVKGDRKMVEAFRQAAIKGWRYALDHPDEIIDLLQTQYKTQLSRAALEFEAAETRRLVTPDVVEPGYMHEGRWRHIAEGYAKAGLMSEDFSLDGFLYDPHPEKDLGWLYTSLAGLAAFSLAVSAVLFRFHRMNRALSQEIQARQALEGQLRLLATTDPLTGIANRRQFMEQAKLELARSRRMGHPVALLMIDIDRFKGINDSWGHATGDRVLTAFANVCVHTLRQIDVVGRLGGEEFGVLLPEAVGIDAVTVAERIRVAARDLVVQSDGNSPVSFTISVGVAVVTPDETVEQTMSRADRALYAAKHEGRDRVRLCPENDAARVLSGPDPVRLKNSFGGGLMALPQG